MVDYLVSEGINLMFVIGGDGSMRGAMSLTAEIERRGLHIGVVGVPKTIDNDIEFIDRSFGFETAFAAGVEAINSAQTEARGMRNGIGLVKLMGRHSGFIACTAALATANVTAVLIPEVPLHTDGEHGLFAFLEKRLAKHGHATVVVAEGAGQHLCVGSKERDASGNLKLQDIGSVLKDSINKHFDGLKNPVGCGLLLAHGPQRRACGHGRQHRDADRPLARALRARADAAGDTQPQACRSDRRPVELGDRGHRPAGRLHLTHDSSRNPMR
jgi:6-phosphofructokinase